MRAFIKIIVLLLTALHTVGQTQQDEVIKHPNIIPPSPDAQSFQRYGDYPVDYSTGVPKIEIPLFDITSGKLKLPISISYHASGIKVGDISSVVGLGWTLKAGGLLTRTVKGFADESSRGILNHPIQTIDQLNNSSWYNQANYNSTVNYLFNVGYGYQDAETDDYSYSVGTGLSGGFIYDNTGTIKQTSFDNDKIIKHIDNNGSTSCWYEIISSDGTHYIFNKKENCKMGNDPELSPSSWWLTKITSADNKDKIEFEYETDGVDFHKRILVSQSWDFNTGINGYNDNGLQFSFQHTDTYRVYLKKISFTNGYISFNYLSDRKDLEDKRLSTIEIFSASSLIKKYSLIHSNFYSGYADDKYNYRLKLSKIYAYDKELTKIYENEFQYYEQDILPPYMYPDITYSYQSASYAIDLFGYYNGQVNNQCLIPNLPPAYAYMSPNRTPNIQYIKACSLKKIIHPTGGSTEFEYGANIDYQGNVTGGLRIEKITSYAGANAPPLVKTYTYTNNLLHMDMDSYANYNYQQVARVGQPGNYYTEYRNVYTDDPVVPYQMFNGSFALYQIVDEVLDDDINNAHLKTKYTYAAEPNIVYSVESDRYKDQYFIERSWRRGQLLGSSYYDYKNGAYTLQKSISNEYIDKRDESIINSIKIQPRLFVPPVFGTQSCGNGNNRPVTDCFFYFNTWIEIGSKKLSKQYTNLYDNNGNVTLKQTQEYTYSSNNHLFPTKITTWDSKKRKVVNEMQHPHDLAGNVVYDEMITRNIVEPVISQTRTIDGNFLSSSTTKYDFWNGGWSTSSVNSLIKPRTVEIKNGNNPVEVRSRYHSYDANGNIKTYSNEIDVKKTYLWGYNSQYVVAEIVGSDDATVGSLVNQSVLDNPTSDQALQNELANLRSVLLPLKTFVTTYTYKPLVGMTSKTDPGGNKTFYEYDGFGRLAYIRDQNQNILKKYCYNYAGQPEDCFTTATPTTSTVYVKLVPGYVSYSNFDNCYYQHQELTVACYQDEACTIPLNATNLDVTLQVTSTFWDQGSPTPSTYPLSITCNGPTTTSNYILYSSCTSCPGWDQCLPTADDPYTNYSYTLAPGTGYTIK